MTLYLEPRIKSGVIIIALFIQLLLYPHGNYKKEANANSLKYFS